MSDSVENGLVDPEIQDALQLSKADLVEMLNEGEPAELARRVPHRRTVPATTVTVHSADVNTNRVLHSTNATCSAVRRRARDDGDRDLVTT